MDAIAAFAEHVTRTRYDDLPAAAIEAAKVLILDSLGVGVVGSAGPFVPELARAAGGLGSGAEARVWVSGDAAAGAGRRALQRLSAAQFRVRLHPRARGGPPDGGAAAGGDGPCRARGRRLGP